MDNLITDYLQAIEKLMGKLSVPTIKQTIEILYDAYENDKQVFIMGNGGGAASSSHFACDLAKGTIAKGKKRFRVISLTDNVPLLTAWANDTNYTNVFGEQLYNLMNTGDVLIGLSASGMSPNIINAFLLANDLGATTIGIVGFKGGTVKQVVTTCLVVPTDNIQQIEDVQTLLLHLISSTLAEKIKGG